MSDLTNISHRKAALRRAGYSVEAPVEREQREPEATPDEHRRRVPAMTWDEWDAYYDPREMGW